MRDLGQRFRTAASHFDWLSDEQRTISRGAIVTRVHYMLLGTSPDGYRVRVRVRHRVGWRGPGAARPRQGVLPVGSRLDCVISWPRSWKVESGSDLADDRFKHHWSGRRIRSRRYAFLAHRSVDLTLLVHDMLDAARTVAAAPKSE